MFEIKINGKIERERELLALTPLNIRQANLTG